MKKFISGMLFVIVGWPLLDNTMQVFAQYTECLKAKMALKVYEMNEMMGLSQHSDETRHLIGFSAPTENYYDDEEGESN